jgi:dienelactone hydrolase
MMTSIRQRLRSTLRDLAGAPPAVRWAVAAVSLAGVPAILAAGASAQLGLGPIGDALAAMILLLVRTAILTAAALALGMLFQRRAVTLTALVAALIAAVATTLDVVMPLAFAGIYISVLLCILAWVGAALGHAWRRTVAPAARAHAVVAVAASCGMALWLAGSGPGSDTHADQSVDAAMDIRDATAPGPFQVHQLTYGSGMAQRRGVYADAPDVESRTADMRSVLSGFGGWRARLHARYWGFTPDRVPLNGRIWQPAGAGVFPVVVIVHGQYSPAAPSEEGFAYLGELLASRGYIVAAIDQTFLNGPWISGRMHEIPARAWLLEEHLELLAQWHHTEDSPLHGRLDLERVAVVGHSRGAEAALLAARYTDFDAVVEGAHISVQTPFAIDAVVAFAPTARVTVRGVPRSAQRSVSYLVLQGAQDADVASFLGTGPYHDLVVGTDSTSLKAAIYIAGANHSGFNSSWREHDVPPPLSWLLNRRAVMRREEQQRFAAYFTSAFLDATLKDDAEFRTLLREPLRAAAMLPPHRFIAHYHEGDVRLVDTFDEDEDRAFTSLAGGHHVAYNIDLWRNEDLLLRDRFDTPQGNSVLHIAWDRTDGDNEELSVFEIHVPDTAADDVADGTHLVFSIAVLSEQAADLTLELVSENGARAALPLSRFARLRPAIGDPLWKSGLVQDFMIRRAEQVLQTVEIPLAAFEAANPAFDADTIDVVRLRFDRAPAGEILLDDVGFRHGG